jgi:hypothetical protein
MGEFVGGLADLARLEIAYEIEDQFGVRFTDADVSAWRTVGDLHRSILARSAAAGDNCEDWARLQRLPSESYGVPAEWVVAEAALFGEPLRLDERGSPRWPAPAPRSPTQR